MTIITLRKPVKFVLPFSEFDFSFVRSSGPGGQNVNKVNSKAVLRWKISESPALSLEVRTLLLEKLASRISAAGDLIIMSDRFRDQKQNKDDCIEKLIQLVDTALTVQKPRKNTKPTKGSTRRVKEAKTKNSDKKKMRGKVQQ